MKDRKLWLKKLKGVKGFDSELRDAAENAGGIPPAVYASVIKDAKMVESKKGDPMIAVSLEIENDEEYEGENATSFMGLGESSRRFTFSTLKRLGYEFEGEGDIIEEILDVVEDLSTSEKRVKIKVGTTGLANIQSLIDEDEEESQEEEEDSEEEEELENEEQEETEDEEEDEDEKESEESSGEIEEGSFVSWEKNGETLKGTIVEIFEEDNIARVEKESGGFARVIIEKLTLVEEQDSSDDEDEEEIEEEPKQSIEEEDEEMEEAPKPKAKKSTKPVTKKKVAKKKAVTKKQK